MRIKNVTCTEFTNKQRYLMKFLTAHWKNLIFINYKITAELLYEYLPAHMELDDYRGQYYVSVVAFKFHDTRLKGVKIPFHVNFDEINLRFYVKRRDDDELRRGVVFVKEIVPKRAITFVANLLYNENYVTRSIDYEDVQNYSDTKFCYAWNERNKKQSLLVTSTKNSERVQPGSLEEFITEHYYGYSKLSNQYTIEYRVEHPSWEVQNVSEYDIKIDFGHVYGSMWGQLNHIKPDSLFVAKGSLVSIYHKQILKNKSKKH